MCTSPARRSPARSTRLRLTVTLNRSRVMEIGVVASTYSNAAFLSVVKMMRPLNDYPLMFISVYTVYGLRPRGRYCTSDMYSPCRTAGGRSQCHSMALLGPCAAPHSVYCDLCQSISSRERPLCDLRPPATPAPTSAMGVPRSGC